MNQMDNLLVEHVSVDLIEHLLHCLGSTVHGHCFLLSAETHHAYKLLLSQVTWANLHTDWNTLNNHEDTRV